MFKELNKDFLFSAITDKNPFIQTPEVFSWLKERNNEVEVIIDLINFSQLNDWCFTENQNKLVHKSGNFFSIEGIHVNTNSGFVKSWDQPIINQPEIGYLGIITKKIDGIIYFLLQAKVEPGNVNNVQLSPTLQATKSNYSQIHGGKKPPYLEYFQNISKSVVILDQLQSEQGARFLKKRNRNIIILIEEEIPVYENFLWLTLGQIKKLILHDNIINMDTRTVISGINFQFTDIIQDNNISDNELNHLMYLSSLNGIGALHSFDQLIAWITTLKCKYELEINTIPLSQVKDWNISDNSIERFDKKYFKVIATQITISSREVTTWSQPMIQPAQGGIISFIVKKIKGIIHFLVQAKLECGNFDIIEMAPTVQCLTGDFRKPDYKVPCLEYILNARNENIIYNALQSEEGGRFYLEQNKNIIVLAEDDFQIDLPENYIWMTLNQINTFIRFNNYFNIQARSLISAVSLF